MRPPVNVAFSVNRFHEIRICDGNGPNDNLGLQRPQADSFSRDRKRNMSRGQEISAQSQLPAAFPVPGATTAEPATMRLAAIPESASQGRPFRFLRAVANGTSVLKFAMHHTDRIVQQKTSVETRISPLIFRLEQPIHTTEPSNVHKQHRSRC
jgi:hypothetical protein